MVCIPKLLGRARQEEYLFPSPSWYMASQKRTLGRMKSGPAISSWSGHGLVQKSALLKSRSLSLVQCKARHSRTHGEYAINVGECWSEPPAASADQYCPITFHDRTSLEMTGFDDTVDLKTGLPSNARQKILESKSGDPVACA
jgi:hypothetical protein